MKKISSLHFSFILAVLFTALLAFSLQAQAYGAWGQAQQANDDGQSAVQSNSDEEASTYAGYNFDTPSVSPPVVDLSGAGEHPTPQLLRNEDGSNPYTPKKYQSLHITPPPMP
jgi:hypothetical protein